MRKIFGHIAGKGFYASIATILVYGISLAVSGGATVGGFLAWTAGSVVLVTALASVGYILSPKK
jgi:hypothetical protein